MTDARVLAGELREAARSLLPRYALLLRRAADALEREPVTAEEMVPIIARRLAKRYWGEHYEGYESSQREAAEDIAAALNRAKGEQK